jgi:uncharacterized glyoxalase superfamily protein PhnB
VKKLLGLLIVGGLLALTTGCPPGTTSEAVKPPPPPPPPPVKTAPSPVKGTLKKVDGSKITVGTNDPIEIPDSAKITGDAKSIKDLKADDNTTVTVTFDVDKKVTSVDVVVKAATPPPPDLSGKVSGKVTKSDAGKITVKPETGEAKDFTITDDKVVMIDGKPGKAADIAKDSTATVTTDKDGKITAVDVKGATPPPPPPDLSGKVTGKVTKSDAGKITVKPETGDAKDFTIADDKVVMIDGKPGKAADIAKDNTVTVTTDKDGKITAVEVKTK